MRFPAVISQAVLVRRSAATPQVSLTPVGTTNQSVSENSRSDYSIYTVMDNNEVVVAVLIEAMTTHSKFTHALGQVHFQSSIYCVNHTNHSSHSHKLWL